MSHARVCSNQSIEQTISGALRAPPVFAHLLRQEPILDSSPWNLLHDGSIERINGSVPGVVTVLVSIDYLRSRFPGEGTGFVVHLAGCTHFAFQPFNEAEISDLAAIAALAPEILGVKATDPLEICCVTGMLTIRYEDCAIYLDCGTPIALSELDSAAESYWRDWSKRHRTAP